MKAYYRNGKLYFAKAKRLNIKFLVVFVVLIAWILITLTPFNSSKSDFKHDCGIEIPGIKDQTFCIGYDQGVYYENEKMKVRIK